VEAYKPGPIGHGSGTGGRISTALVFRKSRPAVTLTRQERCIPSGEEAASVLAVRNLEVVYDDVMLVLRGVSLEVPDGRIVALLGANGAGKSTLLRAMSGLLDIHEGDVTRGSVTLDDVPIHHLGPSRIAAKGIKQVMEGRRIFAELTVEENLRIGAHVAPRTVKANLARSYDLFPVLADRRRSTAGYLSGGEQQMLAIGRALMSEPRYLLLDEPSLGLAPLIVQQIRDVIVQINKQGTTVLLVEQNAAMALSIAEHGYVLENGAMVMDKPAGELLADDDVREFYLGLGAEGTARSFRDVKHYKRRKRWLS
jgi:branched-chain amino acid transport system ATP-binding protein